MTNEITKTAKRIQDIFKKYNIKVHVTDEMFLKFAKFYFFLIEYNKKYNLTRLTAFEDVAIKHFVDCVYVAQLMDLPPTLLDLGTGAGFPGVPLKIISPQTRILLAEGVQKKVDFLKELRQHLDLKGLDIIGRNVDSKMQYPVTGVITRAVEPISATLKNVTNCLQSQGYAMFMKTPGIENEITEAQMGFAENFEIVENIDYKLGTSSHDRKLVVFRKRRTTV